MAGRAASVVRSAAIGSPLDFSRRISGIAMGTEKKISICRSAVPMNATANVTREADKAYRAVSVGGAPDAEGT